MTGQQYEPAAINTFLQVADFYLVAHALAGGHIVVTHEVAANSVKRIKIPNVCAGLGLRFMTPYEMLRVGKSQVRSGRREAVIEALHNRPVCPRPCTRCQPVGLPRRAHCA